VQLYADVSVSIRSIHQKKLVQFFFWYLSCAKSVSRGLSSHLTYYRSFSGMIWQVRWPNQQRQSTERSQLVIEITHQAYQVTSAALLVVSKATSLTIRCLGAYCDLCCLCCLNTDDIPYFTCPVLRGPTVIDRQWFEFYCEFTTTSTNTRARFRIEFLFDHQPVSTVSSSTVSGRTNQRNFSVTLHERYLQGQLGKSVGLSDFSRTHYSRYICYIA